MRTPANIAGHPIHPMLVALPIGLWIFSLACDLFGAAGVAGAWSTVAFYTIAGGLAGAVLAAIPGLIDLVSLPEGPKRTAIVHMTLNVTVVALFALNLWLRERGDAGGLPLALSFVAIGLLAVSGWLGGKLVYLHGVAVSGHDEAAGRPDAARSSPRPGEALRDTRRWSS